MLPDRARAAPVAHRMPMRLVVPVVGADPAVDLVVAALVVAAVVA